MAYDSPAALRQALETRLGNQSRETGTDLERLRRRAAFERLLVRLELGAPHRWVVKGGMALEMRLGDRARSTRDLDLALRDLQGDGSAVRELLIDCLSVDREGDGFVFLVGEPTTITLDEAGRPGWRFSIELRLAGRTFAKVRLDIVARDDEVTKTQRVALPGVLDFAGLERHDVEVVDPVQHFAEKVHAFTRTYGDRPQYASARSARHGSSDRRRSRADARAVLDRLSSVRRESWLGSARRTAGPAVVLA